MIDRKMLSHLVFQVMLVWLLSMSGAVAGVDAANTSVSADVGASPKAHFTYLLALNEEVDSAKPRSSLSKRARDKRAKKGVILGLPVWAVLGGIALVIIALIVLIFWLVCSKDKSCGNQIVGEDSVSGDAQYPKKFDMGNGAATCQSLPGEDDPVLASLQFGEKGSRGTYPISKTAIRLGRGEDNDLSLNNDSVSRHHAEILSKSAGSFSITDLDSGNGVFINGEEVSEAILHSGDKIEIGEVHFTFVI